jgi:hypothetical protein
MLQTRRFIFVPMRPISLLALRWRLMEAGASSGSIPTFGSHYRMSQNMTAYFGLPRDLSG